VFQSTWQNRRIAIASTQGAPPAKFSVHPLEAILGRKGMAQLHESTATVGFQSTIKPFFTACYRTHMLQVMQLDLWDGAAVQSNWGLINTAVTSGGMPKAGCPEGVWDPATKTLFLSDFLAWKNAGYPA
jgi:hypothetical protein